VQESVLSSLTVGQVRDYEYPFGSIVQIVASAVTTTCVIKHN
jgi:hypothetical protein